MKNQIYASVLAGILFGFSALMILFNKDEPLQAALLAFSALTMVIYAYQLKNKKTSCSLKSKTNEN